MFVCTGTHNNLEGGREGGGKERGEGGTHAEEECKYFSMV